MSADALRETVAALVMWLASHTSFAVLETSPQITFIEQAALAERVCGRPCDIVAWTPYDPPDLVYLSEDMNPVTDICDRAVLLHEIVHLLQQRDGRFADLDAATLKHRREMEALLIQNNFLREHGRRILYSGGFAARFKRFTPPGTSSSYC